MRSLHFVVAGVLALVTARSASGRTTAEFDRQIGAELRARDPASAAVFDEANALRAKGDHAGAEAGYRKVFEAAPWFVHARRRQGFELLMMFGGTRRSRSRAKCARASAAPENRVFLAVVIAAKEKMSKEEWKEANELARAVEREAREDAPIQQSVAGVAMRTGDLALLDAAVTNLKALAPRDPRTLRLDAILQLGRGRFREAKKILLEAAGGGPSRRRVSENVGGFRSRASLVVESARDRRRRPRVRRGDPPSRLRRGLDASAALWPDDAGSRRGFLNADSVHSASPHGPADPDPEAFGVLVVQGLPHRAAVGRRGRAPGRCTPPRSCASSGPSRGTRATSSPRAARPTAATGRTRSAS